MTSVSRDGSRCQSPTSISGRSRNLNLIVFRTIGIKRQVNLRKRVDNKVLVIAVKSFTCIPNPVCH
jgi:hypothetical protein